MHTGMLWFDNSQTALTVKIQKAVEYYHKKYGRNPDLCLVHPSMLETNQRQLEVNKLTVRPYRPVLPGHIWIGIEDKN
jgi:tRNA A58 N-methylase Trm61